MKTKNCANSECKKIFEYKNPKKKFCSLYCKNQAAYIYQQKYYDWEITMLKARRKNMQIIEYLVRQANFIGLLEDLKKMGFDLNAGYIPNLNDDNLSVFRYGNIGMCLLSKMEYEFFKI
jgi:hypothetical protein